MLIKKGHETSKVILFYRLIQLFIYIFIYIYLYIKHMLCAIYCARLAGEGQSWVIRHGPCSWAPCNLLEKRDKQISNFRKLHNGETHLFFFWPCPWHVRVPGQGSNPSHSSDNTGSLTCWATREQGETHFFYRSRKKGIQLPTGS